MSAALIAPVATPVASPWTIRAANSMSTSWATANITMPTICTGSAISSTGRRPTRSDSEPAKTSAVISAST
jgi:hypothetical protein